MPIGKRPSGSVAAAQAAATKRPRPGTPQDPNQGASVEHGREQNEQMAQAIRDRLAKG